MFEEGISVFALFTVNHSEIGKGKKKCEEKGYQEALGKGNR